MSASPVDLEANVVSSPQIEPSKTYFKGFFSRNTTEEMLDTIAHDFREGSNYKIALGAITLLLTIAEITYARSLLGATKENPEASERTFVQLAARYDAVLVIFLILKITYLLEVKRFGRKREQNIQNNSPQETQLTNRESLKIAVYYVIHKLFAYFITFLVYLVPFYTGVLFTNYYLSSREETEPALRLFMIIYFAVRFTLAISLMAIFWMLANFPSLYKIKFVKMIFSNPLQLEVKSYINYSRMKAECPICLTDFEEKDSVVVLKCDNRHVYHEKCAEDWFAVSATCPVCRVDVN